MTPALPPNVSPNQLMAEASRAHQHGQFELAERLYRKLLDGHPDHPAALHFLGLLAHQTGRTALADQFMQRSLAAAPQDPGFQYNYACVLAERQHWLEALPYYRRALELKPDAPDGWHGFATALQATGRTEDAVACWQRCLELMPSHQPALRGLADALRALGRHAEEVEICRRLYTASGAVLDGVRLAEATLDAGDPDGALRLSDELLAVDADLPDAQCLRGLILSARGEFGPAADAFRAAIDRAGGYHEAVVHLAGIRRLHTGEPIVKGLLARATGKSWRDLPEAVNSSFALGRILEDAADYDEAFAHYLEGNRLYRGSIDYSTAAQRRYFDRIRQVFGRDLPARAWGTADRRPIFIVGMPRSGTTLAEQILAAHPQVRSGGELTLLSTSLRRLVGADFQRDMPGAVAALQDPQLRALGAEYLAYLRSLSGSAARVTDKMPSNFMHLGLIARLFPDASIVHVTRDPLDTCVSCFTTLFRNGQLFSYDLQELGEFHRLYRGLMRFWEETFPGRIHRIDYQRLVTETESESRRLLEHCGLEWDARCLDFNNASNLVRTASVFQVRQPIYRSSVQRWRRFERHLGPLIQALGAED